MNFVQHAQEDRYDAKYNEIRAIQLLQIMFERRCLKVFPAMPLNKIYYRISKHTLIFKRGLMTWKCDEVKGIKKRVNRAAKQSDGMNDVKRL